LRDHHHICVSGLEVVRKVKLYSSKRWTLRGDCPSKLLKLMSHVSAMWSVRRWNSCPFRYLWEVPFGSRNNSALLCLASCCSKLRHVPARLWLGRALLECRSYFRLSSINLSPGCGLERIGAAQKAPFRVWKASSTP
jgi:hypothetical protein